MEMAITFLQVMSNKTMQDTRNYKDKYPELRKFFICYFSEDAGYINGQNRLSYEEIMNGEVKEEYVQSDKKQSLIEEINSLLNEQLSDDTLKKVLVEGFHASDISNMQRFLNAKKTSEVLLDVKKRLSIL